MIKKKSSVTQKILNSLLDAVEYLPLLETPYGYIRRTNRLSQGRYYSAVHQLKKRGAIQITSKAGKKFLKLTKKGQLETLLAKARLADNGRWDGKWRLIVFDIPEAARKDRDRLRSLLKSNRYQALQNSVYVSPYPLNRAAIEYLKQTKLIDYIRIARVEEFDYDKDLKSRFKL